MLSTFSTALLALEMPLRLGAYAGVFTLLAIAEQLAPRRPQAIARWRRWPANLGITLLGSVMVRALLPLAAVGVALLAEAHDFGLLHRLALPGWLAGLVGFVLLDLAIYAQHRLFHRVPFLWRLHRMHHADLELDVSSGGRFHPLEILLSMGIKMGVVGLLGVEPLAVLIFEVVLNALAMFNHANIALPTGIDDVLRRVIVTPDVHRVHHSTRSEETNSNFAFNLSCWDRLFGTWRDAPAAGQLGMTLGLDRFRDPRWLRFERLLLLPFVDDVGPLWIDADVLRPGLRDACVIDVRGVAEFDGELGHLPGAINIPFDTLASRLDELARFRGRPLTIVCLTDVRSAQAARLLQAAGYTDVRVLRGGMRSWRARGYPIGADPTA